MRALPHPVRSLTHPPSTAEPFPEDEQRDGWLVSYSYTAPSAKLHELLGLLECRQEILSRLGLIQVPLLAPERQPRGDETLVVVLLRWTSKEAFQVACDAREVLPYERLMGSLCSQITLRRCEAVAP